MASQDQSLIPFTSEGPERQPIPKTSQKQPAVFPLLDLPVEILTRIGEVMGNRRSLAHLVRASKTCYWIWNQVLYSEDVKYGRSSSLFYGARRGLLNTVRLAHTHGADLSRRTTLPIHLNPYGNYTPTALHYAVSNGSHDVIGYLTNNDADSNVPAVGFCNCTVVHRASGEILGRIAWKPLHTAICRGKILAAKILIASGASVKLSPDRIMHTALHSAASAGNLSIIRFMAANSLIGDINHGDLNGDTALHHLANLRGDAAIDRALTLLVNLGADIERTNNSGCGPLVHACQEENFVLARQLLALGANPDPHRNNQNIPENRPIYNCVVARSDLTRRLSKKARNGPIHLLRDLINKGADVDAPLHIHGVFNVTSLMLACQAADVALVRQLLDAGASVHAVDLTGKTPLEYLPIANRRSRAKVPKIIAILLRHGAYLGGMRDSGRSAWIDHIVRQYGKLDFLRAASEANIRQWDLERLTVGYLAMDRWTSVKHDWNPVSELLALAKRLYGFRADSVRQYLHLGIQRDSPGIMGCLLEHGCIRPVLMQDEAYELERVDDTKTVYFSAEALLAKTILLEKPLISLWIARHFKLYPAEARFYNGKTLLHLACSFEARADVKRSNLENIHDDETGGGELFKAIVERLGPEDVNKFDDNLQTPLAVIVADGKPTGQKVEKLEALLEAGASPHERPPDEVLEELYPDDEEKQRSVKGAFVTPFEQAIRNNWYWGVRLMLDVGCNALPDKPPGSRTSYVHLACRLPDTNILELLLKRGFDANGGEGWPNPPSAMLLSQIWNKKALGCPEEDGVERALKHLAVLLRHYKKKTEESGNDRVPLRVRDMAQQILDYTGQDNYKKGIRKLLTGSQQYSLLFQNPQGA